MLKIVPTAPLTSIFEEPSSGSISTAYLASGWAGNGVGSSSSSEAMTQTRPAAASADVELLLFLTLDVDRPGRAEDVDQAGPPDRRGHQLGPQRDVVEQVGEFTRRLRNLALLLEDERFDRGNGAAAHGYRLLVSA
jgi:hypothetical protein